MKRLRKLTNVTIGYSDHTIGTSALQYAVAQGAEILEFHFTDIRENKSFRDHLVSLTKDEVSGLIEEIKLINSLDGRDKKEPLPIEIENGHVESFRRAIYPRMDISANTIIGEQHLITLRPNHGISASSFYDLIGKKCMVDLKQYQKLDWTYFN
jgi:N-acetylneuraminate synthase/N,N'-diacetyllegionaminate synthase